MLIDTHCHIHELGFYTFPMALDVLRRAQTKGVQQIICVGTSLEDSCDARSFAFELAKENTIRRSKIGPLDKKMSYRSYPNIHWTFGVHPEGAQNVREVREIASDCREEVDRIFRTAYASKVSVDEISVDDEEGDEASVQLLQLMPMLSLLPIAIGEVGLDYHYADHNRIAQIRLFEEMLQLANKYGLPVIFHVREAFDDFFPLVANFPKLRGVVHCFADSRKNLRRVLEETEFYVGVNGLATYSTLPTPPLERTVLETDAPFLTPKPFRDRMNEPGYVREVADWLAAKLRVDVRLVEQETSKNARRLFQI